MVISMPISHITGSAKELYYYRVEERRCFG
jgi:hypothetical protein